AGAAGAAGANADSAELGKFDSLAHRFWDPQGEFRPLHLLNPVRMQFVLERAGLEHAGPEQGGLAGARALDVGCGGGLLAESLSRAGARVTAIDLAPAMIEAARAHALEGELPIDYRLESAEALAAAEPRSFDIVTCMEMLEHVPDPAATLGALARLARPGGHVFVSTLHRNLRAFLAAIVAAEYVLRLLPRGTHEYERFIRPSELARWGRAAGLTLHDIAGLKLDPFSGQCRATRDPSVNYVAHFVWRASP
ncbi:MAG: bifunctional 2-polyprenyl-6-hydroxyphenol methylase/3-demethylubiquinol 3-O-methyltransferase UbiG, partial [Steroidobacteraceae bacterium]